MKAVMLRVGRRHAVYTQWSHRADGTA